MNVSRSRPVKRCFALTLLLVGFLQTSATNADDFTADRAPLVESLVDGRYTIQLLALPDRQALEDFVIASGVSGLMAKQVERNGENHYVLFTGSYSDRLEALAAAEHLPASLSGLTPWIRPLDPLLK